MQTVHVRGRVFNYSHTIGRNAVAGPGFRLPMDLARGEGNIIYVVNRGDEFQPCQHVSVVTTDEEFLKDFASIGDADGQFVWPTAITLDSNGDVYVADEWLNRITVYDKDGNFLRKWGEPGSENGQLRSPAGMVFDTNDDLYVTEELNHRVSKFTKDGQFLFSWGQEGSKAGEFRRPWGITLDHSGDIYVADWHNARIQKFSSDGSFIREFGEDMGTEQGLGMPSDVAVDDEGDVYAVDWGNNRVQIYTPDGEYITTFIGDAERLSKWAQSAIDANPDYIKARQRVRSLEEEWRFTRPTSIEIDNDGKIFITDTQRGRIQVYQKEQSWVEPQFNL